MLSTRHQTLLVWVHCTFCHQGSEISSHRDIRGRELANWDATAGRATAFIGYNPNLLIAKTIGLALFLWRKWRICTHFELIAYYTYIYIYIVVVIYYYSIDITITAISSCRQFITKIWKLLWRMMCFNFYIFECVIKYIIHQTLFQGYSYRSFSNIM